MRQQSTCVKWMDFLSYGFLAPTEVTAPRQIYVGGHDVPLKDRPLGKLRKGDVIEFELEITPAGPRARKITFPEPSTS